MKTAILIIFLTAFLGFATLNLSAETPAHETDEFKDYWYSGNAEITSYKLEQARYGEIHKGYAVLIFVTEDFSKSKHVKLDDPYSNNEDSLRVLKLNLVKKFNTGVYRYSIMKSVFTPVNTDKFPDTLKLSSSSQEWCGNTFTQVNLDEDNYNVQLLSYFEIEGDQQYSVDKTFLEDEIFARIRLNPQTLPVGKIKLMPSLIISRLKHQQIKPVYAEATLKELNKEEMQYSLDFPDTNRKFTVVFNKGFPHEINSWEETYKSGFGPNAKHLVTKATKNKSINIDYWNRNSTLDEVLRSQLGIE